MTDEGEIGARIRQLREEAGLTQSALAGEGISASYVSLIESGKRKPTTEALAVIAARLNIPMSDLYAGIIEREEVARFKLPVGLDALDDLRRAMQRMYGLDIQLVELDGWLVARRPLL